MVSCESCGREVENLQKVNISGSLVNACNNCKSLGSVVGGVSNDLVQSHSFRRRGQNNENSLEVIANYSSLINSALAKKGYDFHQLAKATNIKESSITKYLSGKIHLDVVTAKKIEKFLDLKLVDEVEEVNKADFISKPDESLEPLSLGDLIKKQLENSKK